MNLEPITCAPDQQARLCFFVTSTACYVGVAPIDTETCTTFCTPLEGQSQSKILTSAIDHALKQKHITQLTSIITPSGPGSFTSIRVTLATAQGLSIAEPNAICYAPTFFDMFLYDIHTPACVIIDSKRGDFFIKMNDALINTAVNPFQDATYITSDICIISTENLTSFMTHYSQMRIITDPDTYAILMDIHYIDQQRIECHDPLSYLPILMRMETTRVRQEHNSTFSPYYLIDPIFKKSES